MNAVMAMYEGTHRTTEGGSKAFDVKLDYSKDLY